MKQLHKHNDSIISIYNMSAADRTAYFEKYIVKLKKEDEAKKKLAEKAAKLKENQERNDGVISILKIMSFKF